MVSADDTSSVGEGRDDRRDVLGIAIDVMVILAMGTALAIVGAVVGALYIVWVADTFLVGP